MWHNQCPMRLRPKLPKTRAAWLALAEGVLVMLAVAGMIGAVVAPVFADLESYGGHDWDQMAAHRYLITKTILQYRQFPFWNPYGCGGHPSWGGLESGTTIVSPWFPFYLGMKLQLAQRVELVGTAVISAIGAYLFAGRFTTSKAARAIVCVLFAVNGRWALQAAAGHVWHLYYAYTPWVLFFFDRACGGDPEGNPPKIRDAVVAGIVLAMMVYAGAIYPLPQTAFIVALYSVFAAARLRSPRPLGMLAIAGAVSFGLSAPKLLPLLDALSRFPRLIDSPETFDFTALVAMLTSPDQSFGSRPANVSHWGWHEYGMYVGWAGVLAMIAGALYARGVREGAWKWVALVLFILGFGAFAEYAPWAILHKGPIFKSQHVPSRWHYPCVLVLGAMACSVVERVLRRSGKARVTGEIALLGLLGYMAYDVSNVARLPMQSAFHMKLGPHKMRTDEFHQEKNIPAHLRYLTADYAPPALPAEIENVGTIECITFPGLNVYVRNAEGGAAGLGAKGRGDPAYRGEAFTKSGVGSARIVKWSPNEVTVLVENANPGDMLVLNQNWDPGWKANGTSAINLEDATATRIEGGVDSYVFRYRPRTWWPALAIFWLTVGTMLFVSRRLRQSRTQRT